MIVAVLAGVVPLLIWLHLLAGRGGFWLARERDDRDEPPEPAQWPAVRAVVPARNEADVIARSIGSLLAQDYPGEFRVVLVDDQSTDGTKETALALLPHPAHPREGGDPSDASERTDRPAWTPAFAGVSGRLEVLTGESLPSGWTGKLWAVRQGVARASEVTPEYFLLTDADIGHSPDNLRKLVARAEAGRYAMVSLMAKLSCATPAERFLIPAFVFFFDMLYPFSKVNDPKQRTAAAAGGCMLVHRTALEAAGGIASIRHEIIDDCALGRRLKQQGPIWLGLTDRAVSLRPYRTIAEVGRMVSRSAYAQLGYSPLVLAGTMLGLVLTYLAPPAAALFGFGPVRLSGILTWGLMALSFQPMLRFYRASPLWGPALPVIGAAYCWFTVQSAIDVWRGKGGMWKGRAQAMTGQA